MTILNDIRTYCGICPNLVTTPDGAYQYAFWVGGGCDNGQNGAQAFVGKRNRATDVWQIQDVTNAAGGALQLPVLHTAFAAQHRWFAIARDSLGYLHLWGNYSAQSNTMLYLKSANVDDITTWTAPVMPGRLLRNSYPMPTLMPNNDLWFVGNNDNDPNAGSGRADRMDWRLPAGTTTWKGGGGGASARMFLQGNNVANARGPGVPGDSATTGDTAFNWSTYITTPGIDWQRGRVWIAWMFRPIGISENVVLPSCGYSDDSGVTWHAADGSPVTMPIDAVNDPGPRCGVTPGAGFNYSNSYLGPLAIDPATGHPSFTLATAPGGGSYYRITWNGTQWVQTAIPRPIGGLSWVHVPHPIYFNGGLWWRFAAATPGPERRAYLVRDDGTAHIALTPDLNPTGGFPMDDGTQIANFVAPPDPMAYKLYGNLEYLVPVTNTPRVITIAPHIALSN